MRPQVQGEWATRHPKMAELCGQAHELMSQFDSCDIQHVPRAKPLTPSSLISLLTLIHSEFNSEADAQASRATNLAEGEYQEDIAGRGYGRRGY
ncbi:hypothetical protein HID58_053216 [Brassica napus]|uniref:RNase H type-1 domain-containing protein n=1 Tax=Brassica napus TaxID=3708 RepID=A0ABQ8AE31_BRANA|nr:hypothetical protein HID58_053216 [Brassica napus]